MKYTLIAIFLILCTTLSAQSDRLFTSRFQETSLLEIIGRLEKEFEVSFYYSQEDLSGLTFSGSFEEESFQQVLTRLFEDSNIFFAIRNGKVYLTKDVPIITDLRLVADLNPARQDSLIGQSDSTNTYVDVVFRQEYVEPVAEVNNDTVYTIGVQRNFQRGRNASIAGFITDSESKTPLEGAIIFVEGTNRSAISASDGFYSLSLPTGMNEITVRYTGMKTTKRRFMLFSDGTMDIPMQVDVIALNEVIVESERVQNVETLDIGVEKLSVEDTRVVPIVLGERDILKVATTLAGVQRVGEASAGYNVRGGKSDQNLFLLDGATVYNAAHFLGFFSVFNSDGLDGLEVIKSGIPVKYGGRLSSVFEITSKRGRQDKFHGEGGISPITSRLTLEVPIAKEKSSLMLSGRTTYSNWLLRSVDNVEFSQNEVAFSDLLVNYNHQINDKNSVQLSGYLSIDDFKLKSDTLIAFSDFYYSNKLGSAKWLHAFDDSFDMSVAVNYSSYGYDFRFTDPPSNAFEQDFDIEEIGFKVDANYERIRGHYFNAGLESKRYSINPGSKYPYGSESIIKEFELDEEQGIESAVYLSDEIELNDKLSVVGGLRYSHFMALGPANVYLYEEGLAKREDTRIDTVQYASGKPIKTYHGAEFRLSGRYLLSDRNSIKASFTRSRQYIHTLTNTASVSPTDVWRISNYHIKPQVSSELALGYYTEFLNGDIEASIETYYRKLDNLIDFKTGANFLLNAELEAIALQGPGKSYGVEFSLKKRGRLNGWFNYSYARTFIKLQGNSEEETVNNGEYFPTNYDMPHTVNLVSSYDVTKRFSLSYNFVFNTGRPVTVPVSRYYLNGIELVNYSDRNEFRIPDYVRMDFGMTLKWGHRLEKLTHSFWTLSLYNVLGRDNPFSVFFDLREGEVKGYSLTVFGSMIPTISYNFKF